MHFTYLEQVLSKVTGAASTLVNKHYYLSLIVRVSGTPALSQLITLLKHSTLLRLNMLVELIAYDTPSNTCRFTLVYSLLSIEYNFRFFITFKLPGSTASSLTGVFKNSNWSEREVRDMFGITFIGNHDLRRLLTDYGFVGFPLRKDFPLTGYTELRYDDEWQRIVYEPVELTQEFRLFTLSSPWERTAL